METKRIEYPLWPRVFATRDAMGEAAAKDVAEYLRDKLEKQAEVRLIFAAAPSQSEMLKHLVAEKEIAWERVTAFHMDEYIGLPEKASQRFGLWLREAIFDRVPLKAFHLIEPGDDAKAECARYSALLKEAAIDAVLLGVGTNGHLAFNDPPADLEAKELVRVVELDAMCRQQQVDDKCFAKMDDVPKTAVTLTVPALLSAERLFCCVPGAFKRDAVTHMLQDAVSGACPATALRWHPLCTVYLDKDSAPEGLAG